MQDVDRAPVIPVEDPARWLNNLSVTRALELQRAATTLRMVSQLLDVTNNAFDQLNRCRGILEGDVVGNSVQVA